MIEMKLTGWEGIEGMLQGMPDKVQNRALKPAIRQGANIVRDDARMKAPVHAGTYPASRSASFSLKAWRAIEKAGSIDTKYLPGKTKKSRKKYWEFRKPGTLKRSIVVGETPKNARNSLARQLGRGAVILAVGILNRAYYGRWFEGMPNGKGFTDRGGKYHPPNPFLGPSLSKNAQRILDKIRDGVFSQIEKIKRGG